MAGGIQMWASTELMLSLVCHFQNYLAYRPVTPYQTAFHLQHLPMAPICLLDTPAIPLREPPGNSLDSAMS